MERLTHKARYEAGYKLNKGVKEWQAADRLGAYENTGLTPPEIMELKERDTAKKIEINAGVPTCPVCGRRVVRCYDFCPDCGQRLEHKEGRRWRENWKRH